MRIMGVHATDHSCVRRLCANRIVDALLIAKVYLNSGVVCVIRAARRVDEDESKGRQSEWGRLDGFKWELNHSWSLADSALLLGAQSPRAGQIGVGAQPVLGDGRLAWDSNRVRAASTAWCAHDMVVGPGDVTRRLHDEPQDLRVLHVELRVSSPSQATSCRKIR